MPGCMSWSKFSIKEISPDILKFPSSTYLNFNLGYPEEIGEKVGTENKTYVIFGTGFQPSQKQQSHNLPKIVNNLCHSCRTRRVHGNEINGPETREGINRSNQRRSHSELGCPKSLGKGESGNNAEKILRVGRWNSRSWAADESNKGVMYCLIHNLTYLSLSITTNQIVLFTPTQKTTPIFISTQLYAISYEYNASSSLEQSA